MATERDLRRYGSHAKRVAERLGLDPDRIIDGSFRAEPTSGDSVLVKWESFKIVSRTEWEAAMSDTLRDIESEHD